MEELWKDIVGWEGLYAISNLGRIRRIHAKRKADIGKIIKPQRSTSGYPITALWRNNKRKNHFIHILVAKAFLPPRPSSEYEVNHIDADKKNPYSINLEWLTHTENVAHTYKLGRASFGEKHTGAKLKDVDVIEIRNMITKGVPQRTIAAKYRVSEASISFIKHGKNWKHT